MSADVTWITEDSIEYLRSKLTPAEKFAEALQDCMEEVDGLVRSGATGQNLQQVISRVQVAINQLQGELIGNGFAANSNGPEL